MRKYHAKMPASAISLIADWVANRKSDSVDTLVKKLHSDPESKQHKHQQAHAIDSVDQESEKMSLRQVLEGNQRRCMLCACICVFMFACGDVLVPCLRACIRVRVYGLAFFYLYVLDLCAFINVDPG